MDIRLEVQIDSFLVKLCEDVSETAKEIWRIKWENL